MAGLLQLLLIHYHQVRSPGGSVLGFHDLYGSFFCITYISYIYFIHIDNQQDIGSVYIYIYDIYDIPIDDP